MSRFVLSLVAMYVTTHVLMITRSAQDSLRQGCVLKSVGKSTTAMEVELENVLSEGLDHAGDPPEAESASPELMWLAAEQADAVRASFEAPQ